MRHNYSRQTRAGNRAFTLIELLVVISIIGVVLALSFSALEAARSSSLRRQCSNNMRQIGLALQQYHDTRLAFPPGMSYKNGESPFLYMSWHTHLLPFLEQESLWQVTVQAFAQDPNLSHNPPHVGLATVIPVYGCPSDSRTRDLARAPIVIFADQMIDVALTSYLGVEGVDLEHDDGVLYADSHTRIADIKDGTSSTLLVGERPPSPDMSLGWWYGGAGQMRTGSADVVLGVREINKTVPLNLCPELAEPAHFVAGAISNQCDIVHFWSLHPEGANFLFADGSVHFLSYSADSVMPALATRAGGEAVTVPDF
jgi:prepilin-type N-terminal cleavage/methylation domain-containing protein/prepilin-type processing-associated H-X9-DG protein